MNLAEAFALYGADGPRRAQRLSAVSRDGAIILVCSSRRFSRPAAGVLRYADTLSDDVATPDVRRTLREHMELARTKSLPVRLIVSTESATATSPVSRTIHVRQDLVGTVVEVDEQRYVVDFTRAAEPT